MAHQWEQVRSQILGLTIQVKPEFAKQKKLGLIDTYLLKNKGGSEKTGGHEPKPNHYLFPGTDTVIDRVTQAHLEGTHTAGCTSLHHQAELHRDHTHLSDIIIVH